MTSDGDFFGFGSRLNFITAMDTVAKADKNEMKKEEIVQIKSTSYDSWLDSHVMPCDGKVVEKNYDTCKEIYETMTTEGIKVNRNELYACVREKYGIFFQDDTRICGKHEKKLLLDF